MEPPYQHFKTSSRSREVGVLEFVAILVLALALVFGVIKPFVVAAYWIPSKSMVPTLQPGDRVLVNKFIYRFEPPDRGDVVILKNPENPQGDPLIKRVVGLPGDEIQVKSGTLYVNGKPQKEPYVNGAAPESVPFGPMKVPRGDVFVMGDNRTNSEDSRYFGPVPEKSIEGEAFMIFWPPDQIRWL